MSNVITTDDYQDAVQALVDSDSLEEAKKIYLFHGPFELEFEGESPGWYDDG